MKRLIGLLVVLFLFASTVMLFSGCDKKCTDTVEVSPPGVPSGVYSITGDRMVTIVWAPVNEVNLDHYNVWQADNAVGPYTEIGETTDNQFVATELTNGDTYYFAVSSVDIYGNESDLSYETIFDTPRPDGSATLKDYNYYPESSGFSFANEQVVPYDDASADVYVDYDENSDAFFLNVGRDLTDLQDFGYTDNLNDIDYAPLNGWSDLGYAELILGHSYIVWTADNHYGVLRVTSMSKSTYQVGFDWAYQTDLGNRELKVGTGEKVKKIVSK